MVTRTTRLTDGRSARKDNPPGQEGPAPAGSTRDLRILSPEECHSLLEPGGVGRVGFATAEGVVILPVNFAVAGKTIIFRTAPDTLLAAYGSGSASFEADRLDEAHCEGWSVLVRGHLHQVTSEHEVQRLEHGMCLEPWAGGARDVYMRITPAWISGRRIRHAWPSPRGQCP